MLIRNTKKIHPQKHLFAFALALIAMPALALQSDRHQPITIDADQATLDQKKQTTTFSGNVIIKQGSIHVQAANVQVSQDQNGKQTIHATGSPVRFGQQLDSGDRIEGQGNRVSYNSATNTVQLIGNAQVKRGGDLAKGELISYNTRTEVYTVSGGKAAGTGNARRVHIVIQPTGK